MTPEISSVTALRSGIAAIMRGDSFSHGWLGVTHYELEFRCLARMGRIVEVYGQT